MLDDGTVIPKAGYAMTYTRFIDRTRAWTVQRPDGTYLKSSMGAIRKFKSALAAAGAVEADLRKTTTAA